MGCASPAVSTNSSGVWPSVGAEPSATAASTRRTTSAASTRNRARVIARSTATAIAKAITTSSAYMKLLAGPEKASRRYLSMGPTG